MRLYKQEIKRLFMMTRVRIIFVLAIIMSILLALLAGEFSDARVQNEDGSYTWLHGRDSIKYIEEVSMAGNGEVTFEGLKDALKIYQDLYREYETDPLGGDGFPLDVYWDQVQPIRAQLRSLEQAYGTNMMNADLMKLSLSDLETFYERCSLRLTMAMESDDVLNNEEYIAKAQSLYAKVDKPFIVSHGYTRDAFDYIEITILMLVLLAAVIVAPVFSERYSSGEDSIIRCTEFGRGKLAKTTLLAVITVSSIMYITGIVAHLLVSDTIFGTETLKESVQVLFSVYSLPSMNLIGLQITLALTGWLCCIAVSVMAACISSIVSESSTSVVIAIIVVFLPSIIYSGMGVANWLLVLFPSAPVGLANNMLYSLVDLRFLSLGGKAIWYPVALVIVDIIEIVLFGVISRVAYIRHQAR